MNLSAWKYKLPWTSHPHNQLVEALDGMLGPADAIALMPYDDGTFFPKPAYFSKDLIGGMGGYETDDGDKIVLDGEGQPVRELFGVPVLLACDPTEHAAAVEPVKALVAHKDDLGEWIRVDRTGEVVQVGPALDPAPVFDAAEDAEEAFANATVDELLAWHLEVYDPKEFSQVEKEELVDEHREKILEELQDIFEEDGTTDVGPEGRVGEGGIVREYMTDGEGQVVKSFTEALEEAAEHNDVTKVYDIAPPSGMYLDAQGDVKLEDATHIAVDQSKVTDLVPTTHSTVEINTALDKARMEEHEEGKFMTYMIYGIIIGAVMSIVMVIILFVMFSIGSGIF